MVHRFRKLTSTYFFMRSMHGSGDRFLEAADAAAFAATPATAYLKVARR
jgi:hypothetical protein